MSNVIGQLKFNSLLCIYRSFKLDNDTCNSIYSRTCFFLQVEYAIEAIKLGSTALGICTSEGVVLAVEKRITSPLLELTTIEKIVEVDKHIGKKD